MYRIVLVLVLFSLSACQTKLKIVCPQLKQYSAMTQAAIKKEFDIVKEQYPAITQFVADHVQLRDVIRKCQKEAK